MSTAAEIAGTDGRVLRARGHRTRARLLAAGAEVIAAKGLHAARVDDIVEGRPQQPRHLLPLLLLQGGPLRAAGRGGGRRGAGARRRAARRCRHAEKGRAGLRAWLDRFADLYEAPGPDHPGLDRGRALRRGLGPPGRGRPRRPGRHAGHPAAAAPAGRARPRHRRARAGHDGRAAQLLRHHAASSRPPATSCSTCSSTSSTPRSSARESAREPARREDLGIGSRGTT